jgi:hypothetical protein
MIAAMYAHVTPTKQRENLAEYLKYGSEEATNGPKDIIPAASEEGRSQAEGRGEKEAEASQEEASQEEAAQEESSQKEASQEEAGADDGNPRRESVAAQVRGHGSADRGASAPRVGTVCFDSVQHRHHSAGDAPARDARPVAS